MKTLRTFVVLLLVFSLGVGSFPSFVSAAAWPTSGWQTATPEAMGMDAGLLAQARDYAVNQGGGSGYITRGGKLVMSWGSASQRYDVKSTTKSIGVTLLGLGLQDGIVATGSTGQSYYSSFGIPPTTNIDTGWLDDITLEHLATHTAGFQKDGGFTGLVNAPGTAWQYSDGGANWLADVLTLRYGQDLHSVLTNRILSPLGISGTDLTWRNNAYRGTTIEGIARREFGSGINVNVDAMAKIGYLYLRNGVWDGAQLIPSSFVQAARTPVPSIVGLPMTDPANYPNASNHYGLLWWNNADGALPNVPFDAYWSWGLDESFIIVIPSLDIVVSRAGYAWRAGWNGDYAVLAPFLTPIVQSVIGNPVNQAPDVSAGIDQSLTQPADIATLNGTVSDDDLPTSTVTTLWEMVSGPAAAIFGNPADVDTTVTLPAVGTYVLRLTADDGVLAASDEVRITVSQPSSGLAGHWQLDDGAGATALDASGNGNSGTLTNGPTWTTGRLNGGLQFDGSNDYVAITDPGAASALDITQDITLGGWVRFDALPTSGIGRNPRILQKGSSASGAPYMLSVWTLDGTRTVEARFVINGSPYTLRGSQSLAPNTWYHLAVVRSGGTLQIYVNGRPDGNPLPVPSGPLSETSGTIYLGESPGNSDGALDGILDDVRLYNRALAPSEVSTLANPVPDTTAPTSPTDLAAIATGPNTVTVTWSAAADPESGVVAYNVYRDTALIASPAGTNFLDADLAPNTAYQYSVSAVNGIGLESSPSAPVFVTTQAPPNQAPTVSAGDDQSTTLPSDTILLAGVVTDDGLPNGTLTTQWTAVSGPGAVGFSDASSVNSAATLPIAGTYILRLSADDGGIIVSDDVTISVFPEPPPPDTSAPSAPTVLTATPMSTTTINLAWSAADDPESGVANYRVYRDSVFLDVALSTAYSDATLSADTTYAYTVTAINGVGLESSPSNQVFATTPPPPNQPPSVNAGTDQAITLPNDSVTLDGTVNDDGLPAGQLTTLWGAVSGPGTITFGDDASIDTTATFAAAGTYVLRLTANDGDMVVTDDVTITVAPAPQPDALFQKYMSFDGKNDYVRFNDPGTASGLDLGADFTISAWVTFSTLSSSGSSRNPRLLQKGADIGSTGAYYLSARTLGAPNVLSLRLKFGGVSYTLDGTQTLSTGHWYHVAAVKSGGTVRLYLNGVQDGPVYTVPTGAPDASDNPFYLGEAPSNGDGALDGSLEDVRLYNTTALSATEIQSTMTRPAVGTEAGLSFTCQLDEGAGQLVHDSSLGGLIGTLGLNGSIQNTDPYWVVR